MLNDKKPSAEKIMDSELHAWLESATDEVCDVIVEAVLPPRRVQFKKQPGLQAPLKSIHSGDSSDRKTLLNDLAIRLAKIIGIEKIHVLQSAGAIVVRATATALQTISKDPQVKAIRKNRRFK